MRLTCGTRQRWCRSLVVAGALMWLVVAGRAPGQNGTLAEPFPTPSPNAALRYQRAMLLLADLDPGDRSVLERPAWRTLTARADKRLPADVGRLLAGGQRALEAAAQGARLQECDFGIDFRANAGSTELPHVRPMTRLARLLLLRGAHAESKGEWERAAVIYFDGLRMGRHMTHQPTLLEALAGVDMLKENYLALANWAVRCPSRIIVARAFGLLETLADDMVQPQRTLSSEATILAMEFSRIQAAYPDGDWAQLILEGYGEPVPEARQAQERAAKSACVKRGVPEGTFSTPVAFAEYTDRLARTSHRFVESAAACMTLPPTAQIRRGQRLFTRYSKRLKPLGEETLVSPAEIGALFAIHDAHLVVVRTVLAVSASKTEEDFPESLDTVANRFGGRLPVSPYDGSPLAYEVFDSGRSISVDVASVEVEGVVLSAVDFDSSSPDVPKP